MSVKNILVITTWAFKDGLIQSSTLPYLRMIHELSPASRIYLATQEKHAFSRQERNDANSELAAINTILIPQQYHRMGVKKLFISAFQFISLFWLLVSKNISHIHCFCTPAGSTGYLLSVLTGKKLILDSYEPHAQAMVENKTWTKDSLGFKILSWFEKKQSSRASFCLNAATGMEEYAKTNYNVYLKEYTVKPCCVDLSLFEYSEPAAALLRDQLGWKDKVVCVYAGKFGGIYLDKEVFDFFFIAWKFWGDKFRVLLLTTLTEKEIENLCNDSGVPVEILHSRSIPFSQMPVYLSAADFGITPVKPVPSKRYCSPIKDGEYWATGLPVIITRDISDDSAIIKENNIGVVLSELNNEEYEMAVRKMDELLKGERSELRKKIRAVAEKYRNYSIAEKAYENIYKQKISKP